MTAAKAPLVGESRPRADSRIVHRQTGVLVAERFGVMTESIVRWQRANPTVFSISESARTDTYFSQTLQSN